MPERWRVDRARIILACAEGMSNAGAAQALGVAVKSVSKWRRQFASPLAAMEQNSRNASSLSRISSKPARHSGHRHRLRAEPVPPRLPLRGPVLQECLSRGIAFVPFCPLSWPRGQHNPVLTSPVVIRTAARLGITPAQVALKWLLRLAPNVLLIPGTGSVAHLRENLAAGRMALDDEALRNLDAVAPWPDDPSQAV